MVVDVADGDVCLVGVITQTVVAAHPHPQPARQLPARQRKYLEGAAKIFDSLLTRRSSGRR